MGVIEQRIARIAELEAEVAGLKARIAELEAEVAPAPGPWKPARFFAEEPPKNRAERYEAMLARRRRGAPQDA